MTDDWMKSGYEYEDVDCKRMEDLLNSFDEYMDEMPEEMSRAVASMSTFFSKRGYLTEGQERFLKNIFKQCEKGYFPDEGEETMSWKQRRKRKS